MKPILLFLILFLNFSNSIKSEIPLIESIKFATLEEANKMLSTEDTYTNQWSEFDVQSKTQNVNANKANLLEYAGLQARQWTIGEQKSIRDIIATVEDKMNQLGLNINIPNKIYFIKTTGKEEGGAAGYTRANYIVLNQDVVSSTSADLRHLIVHELFHVFSRFNPLMRKKLYRIIGFNMMDPIIYPEPIKNKIISNPDAPIPDSYIELVVDGDTALCTMIIYATKAYNGGSFFDYINVGFLLLTRQNDNTTILPHTEAKTYALEDVNGFYEQIGYNTSYIINPEEILADNFTYLVFNQADLPSPWVVDEMLKVLTL